MKSICQRVETDFINFSRIRAGSKKLSARKFRQCAAILFGAGLLMQGNLACNLSDPNQSEEQTDQASAVPDTQSAVRTPAGLQPLPIPPGTPVDPALTQAALGTGTIIYQNTGQQGEYFAPGAGVSMADDLTLTMSDWQLNRIRHVCAYSPGPSNYSVSIQLWTNDPNGCGPMTPISGAWCTADNVPPGVIWDAASFEPCDFPPNVFILGNPVWLVLTFSTNEAGWLLAYQAEIGSTADYFNLTPPDTCTDYVNDYAGQCAEIHADPPPWGACCDDVNGVCTDHVPTGNCGQTGTNTHYGGDGSLCSTLQPPCVATATGACCQSSGGCTVTTQAACNGAYMGNNSTCVPTGACCVDRDGDAVDENCVATTQACCGLAGGSFHGPGSQCAGFGACCYDSDSNGSTDSCRTMAATCCQDAGGVMSGAPSCGETFGDVTPQPNGNGVVNIDDILCVLVGFANLANCPRADLKPCGGNGVVNLDDILSVLKAFSGLFDCPVACRGACCVGGTSCESDTQSQCAIAGGSFQGFATSCAGSPCSLDCNNNGIPDDEEVQGGGVFSFSSAPNQPIPDNNVNGIGSTVFVPQSATVLDVDVSVNIQHSANGDLRVSLVHDNSEVVLVDGAGRIDCTQPGGYSDNGLNVTFDDEATTSIHFYQDTLNPMGATLTGRWRPDHYCGEPALTLLDNNDMFGNWTIRVADTSPSQTGTLIDWTLKIRTTPPTAPDCNHNNRPDICDLTGADCNFNGNPDSCDGDCNGNGMADSCDISMGTSLDANFNQNPDECEPDCNNNGVPDDLDIQNLMSPDCNQNGTPDECDLAAVMVHDRQPDGIPDECQLLGNDCQPNLIPDNWEIASGLSPDCNHNNVPDECDILHGTSFDFNNNGIPDECPPGPPPSFQLFGLSPAGGGEDQMVMIFGSGFDPNPVNYCISVANQHAGAEVSAVTPSSLMLRVEGNTERGIGPIGVMQGSGIHLAPHIGTDYITENGRAFTGFGNMATVGLFNAAPADILTFAGTFVETNGGALTIPIKGDWRKNDKFYVHFHMHLMNPDRYWDYSEEITFENDGTGAQCAQKIKDRYNAAATAAGCNCTATVNGTDIVITCAGGASYGWGSANLEEWKADVVTKRGTVTISRTSTGFTRSNGTDTETIPATTITVGEKTVEYGCKYVTNFGGKAGLMKIVATTGSPTDKLKYVQTWKGTRTRKRTGEPDKVINNEANYVRDGNDPAGPSWPLTQGKGFSDFTGTLVPSSPTYEEGDKVVYDESYQTFIVCDGKVLGFLKWDFKGTLCVGATAADNVWQDPQPSTSKSWVPRDMTAGSDFKMALDTLKGLASGVD